MRQRTHTHISRHRSPQQSGWAYAPDILPRAIEKPRAHHVERTVTDRGRRYVQRGNEERAVYGKASSTPCTPSPGRAKTYCTVVAARRNSRLYCTQQNGGRIRRKIGAEAPASSTVVHGGGRITWWRAPFVFLNSAPDSSDSAPAGRS